MARTNKQMKENSYFFLNGHLPFSNLKDLRSEESLQKKQYKNKNKSTSKYLNRFWNRLIGNPESFSQHPNYYISDILEEEKNICANEKIASILSDKLNLAQNSDELYKAVKNSIKIFHEDFPGDFILEYNGTRLGLFLLDICYDLNNNGTPVYRFKSNLKSFDGLF